MSKKSKLVWTDVARRDLESIIRYRAANENAGSARILASRLLTRAETLAGNPERCRVVPELRAEGLTNYRELIVKPYRLLFRIDRRDVILLGILDGRRDLEELLLERTLEY